MKPLLLASALAMICGQAQALSCMRPDPISTFQRVAAAPEGYYVLYGALSFDEDDLPRGSNTMQDQVIDPIPAQFRGKSLSQDGFVRDYVSPVLLQVNCLSIWCGSAQSGVDAVYFVEATEAPVTMQADPCGDMIFYEPTEAVLDMLTSCMKGDTCSPEPLQ